MNDAELGGGGDHNVGPTRSGARQGGMMKPWWWIVSFLVATWVVPFMLAARSSESRPKWLRKGRNQVAAILVWTIVVGMGLRFLFGKWPWARSCATAAGVEPLPEEDLAVIANAILAGALPAF